MQTTYWLSVHTLWRFQFSLPLGGVTYTFCEILDSTLLLGLLAVVVVGGGCTCWGCLDACYVSLLSLLYIFQGFVPVPVVPVELGLQTSQTSSSLPDVQLSTVRGRVVLEPDWQKFSDWNCVDNSPVVSPLPLFRAEIPQVAGDPLVEATAADPRAVSLRACPVTHYLFSTPPSYSLPWKPSVPFLYLRDSPIILLLYSC